MVGGLLGGLLHGAWTIHAQRYLVDGLLHLVWLELGMQLWLGARLGLALALLGLSVNWIIGRLKQGSWLDSFRPDVGVLLMAAVGLLTAGVLTLLSGWEQGPTTALMRKRGLVGVGFALLALGASGSALRVETRRCSASIRRVALTAIAGAAVVLLGILATARTPSAASKSLLLVTVDTLRADHLTLYGYSRETSPRLGSLATRGRVFLNAYSHAPATGSAVASIMTGQLPRQTGSFNNEALQARHHSLAEYLRDAGYQTAAIVGNFVLRRGRGYEAGFEFYDDLFVEHEAVRSFPERTAENTTRRAIDWLRRHGGKPFFLWVHYQDPHGPYRPPERYRDLYEQRQDSRPLALNGSVSGERGIPSYQVLDGRFESGYYVAQYDGEIRYVDDQFAALVSGLERLGLAQSVVTVLTADHGESMGERDYYFAHGGHLYPGLLHVPLVIWNDGSGCPPISETVVQHLDLAPTLLALAGVKPKTMLRGRDLGSCELSDAEVLSEAAPDKRYQASLLTRRLQVLYRPDDQQLLAFAIPSKLELVDRTEAAAYGFETLARKVRALARHATPGPAETLSEQERDILRSLGYLQ
jgi:arylsulfatase